MVDNTLQTIDKYIVLESLGKGAKSTIWKVEDPTDGTTYTLKRVIRESKEDDRFLEQMKTEYAVSSNVEHPYLRKSFELKRIPRWIKTAELLLLLEFVEGKTLKQATPTDIEVVINIFQKVADGLDSLHQFGYIHADVKPKNILLTADSAVKIIDFGQSCPIGHRKQRIQGTPEYMAPEQVERGILDQRTDVFNLGASMYWVLTGQNFPTTMTRQGSSDVTLAGPRTAPRPDELNPEVPTALAKLTVDCCNYNPNDRPENMREVLARLEVARHLLMRQRYPERFASKKRVAESEEVRSLDDTAEFDEFLKGIL